MFFIAALLIGLAKFRHSDPQHFYAVDFFFIIFLCFIFIFNRP